jgi:hypothetical protein
MIWESVDFLANVFIDNINMSGARKEDIKSEYHIDSEFRWENHLFSHDKFRRAHVEILDARKTKKILVLHTTIFPFYNCPDPIFGFDVVAGENKITGAFHDFSHVGISDLYDWYQYKMEKLEWNKPRNLPPWAQTIFSPMMLAAGNIKTREEVDQLVNTAIDNMNYYLYNVGKYVDDDDYTDKHNHYCAMQKMNPHTPAMMETLGIDKNLFRKFMDDVLFPEYNG